MSIRKVLLLAPACLGLAACVAVVCSRPASFRGHTGHVSSVVTSPGGKTLAVG